MIKLKCDVVSESIGNVVVTELEENLTIGVKEELKEIFKSDISNKRFNDSIYLHRAWLGENERECMCLVLNDKISIYIDENIKAICGDIITGEWLDLDIEECNNILEDILRILAKELKSKLLLKHICNFYWYDLIIEDNKVHIINQANKDFNESFNNVNETLKAFIDTMVTTDEESNHGAIWGVDIINYIKGLN